MPYRSTARHAAQLLKAAAAGPGVGGFMPLPTAAPGFPGPAYTASAPGQAFPQGPAPEASSDQRGAGATRVQAAMQRPTAGRQQPQVAIAPMHAQPGVPTPGAQPQQAAMVPVQRQPQGPSQAGVHQQQQQQAAVVPVQAQAQGPCHVEHQQSSDHVAVQGPSQPAGAAQPGGAQVLQQGSAQPTSRLTHQDRDGQVPVQASGPPQVRAAGACAVPSSAAPFLWPPAQRWPGPEAAAEGCSASCSPDAGRRCCSNPQAAVCQCPAWPCPVRCAPRSHVARPLHVPSTSRQLAPSLQTLTRPTEADFGSFPASP